MKAHRMLDKMLKMLKVECLYCKDCLCCNKGESNLYRCMKGHLRAY
jgi:hypothetical protein